MRRNYALPEIALLVSRYAPLAAATQRKKRLKRIEAQLADLDDALVRVPQPQYEALTLRGLQRRSNRDAARVIGVHPNTMSRRYMKGLRWVRAYLNKHERRPQLRAPEWRDWALQNAESVLEALDNMRTGGLGRPPQIPPLVDERVLDLHCTGSGEREIVRALNDEFVRPDGREWTRASVRSVLRRYHAPRRPRGPRPQRGRYRIGDITKPNYREIEFGEPFCDPSELLRLYRQTRAR